MMNSITIKIDSENITPKYDIRNITELTEKVINGEHTIKISYAFGYKPTRSSDESKVLIVGTIPSKLGYKEGFYYMSKRNNLYLFLDEALKSVGRNSNLCVLKEKYYDRKDIKIIESIENSLHDNGIVLFDTVKCCIRTSSYDSGILDPYDLNSIEDFNSIFENGKNIKKILFTSDKAKEYFVNEIDKNKKYTDLIYQKELSTPSASATKLNKEKAIEEWKNAFKEVFND